MFRQWIGSILMSWPRTSVVLLALVTVIAPGCGRVESGEELVIYSGRSRSLVAPIVDRFETETGITVNLRPGETAQLAVAIREEGDRSPADLFWAQDAGALGAMVRHDRLIDLPGDVLAMVPEHMRNPGGQWVATSGRARTLAYAPARVSTNELPESVFDLTERRYRGRVGWAPTNASFQAFVTAMREAHGDERTVQWLADMKANGVRDYANNTTIIEGIAAGQVDFGLPNHYYLLRFKSRDPEFPVEQTFFAPGDVGNLVNVAGIGVLNTSDRAALALEFVRFVLAEQAQNYFARAVFEYPAVQAIEAHQSAPQPDRLDELAPRMNLDALEDLEGTLRLLRQAGVM